MLKIVNNKIDLGTLKFNKVHYFTAQFLNTDTKDSVKITEVRPGCGSCTVAYFDNVTILPGETNTMKLEFTPNSVTNGDSKIMKSVRIRYRVLPSINEHEMNLTFEAKVTL